MSSTLKYTCTALMGTNKSGILKPDENGYYRMILGAFNIYNSNGIWYDYEASKHIFESSSSFMRRMHGGNLYSEEDHPAWEPGVSFDDYIARIKFIDSKNVCAHLRDIEVVPGEMNPDGTQQMLIFGSVKPDRERGKYLKAALDNPDQNVCFSLRALCEDERINGRIVRIITEFITFDWVIEPGLSVAHKYNAPALEAYTGEDTTFGFDVVGGEDEVAIPIEAFESLLAKRQNNQFCGVGLESDEDFEFVARIVKKHSKQAKADTSIKKPAYLDW